MEGYNVHLIMIKLINKFLIAIVLSQLCAEKYFFNVKSTAITKNKI